MYLCYSVCKMYVQYRTQGSQLMAMCAEENVCASKKHIINISSHVHNKNKLFTVHLCPPSVNTETDSWSYLQEHKKRIYYTAVLLRHMHTVLYAVYDACPCTNKTYVTFTLDLLDH